MKFLFILFCLTLCLITANGADTYGVVISIAPTCDNQDYKFYIRGTTNTQPPIRNIKHSLICTDTGSETIYATNDARGLYLKNRVDIGNSTSVEIKELEYGIHYYFKVTSYTTDTNNESEDSLELCSFRTRPSNPSNLKITQ